jgi:misacylated tRNA(Ala) deacylase
MELIFREDAYACECEATVTAVDERGIWLDRTIFYAEGGGQPGDQGTLTTVTGEVVTIINAVKAEGPEIVQRSEQKSSLGLIGSGDTDSCGCTRLCTCSVRQYQLASQEGR